ncbi:geranylgeranyl reductase family protein [Roseovarius salis]|uniref:geranylgeranyl reductase family protein n=1 Tax=Roseovarius salis TaxID=3376063 RepID=UPI0037CAA49B
MPRFDLVIVGAGPAGAAAAVAGRSEGLSVALIDKARFPRTKLCGGLVTGRCARHLSDIFDLDVDPALFETRRNFEFHLDGVRLGRLTGVPPAHLTMRWDLDAELFRRAVDSGAHDYSGQRIARLDIDRQRVALQSGETLAYDCLIGADGVQSSVARTLFGAPFDKHRIGFALEIEADAQAPDDATPLRIDFAAAEWGYGWVFPKRGSTTIGLGGLQERNPDMKSRLAAYRALLGAESPARVKGHFLPFGDYRTRPGRHNVLLAGDAAGFVDPITGEGIGHAVHSGALAARAAATAIRAERPHAAMGHYRAATRPIRTALRSARLLRPVIFARPLKPFFASTFRASRRLKHDYMRLLSGDTEYPGLLARTALRLPWAAIRWAVRRGTTRG